MGAQLTHQRTELTVLPGLAHTTTSSSSELLAGGLQEVVQRQRAGYEGPLLLEVVDVVEHLQAGCSVGEGGHGLGGVVGGRSVGLELIAHENTGEVEGHVVCHSSTRPTIDWALCELHQVTTTSLPPYTLSQDHCGGN